MYKVLLILSVSTAVVSSTPNLRAITTNYLSLKRLYNNKSTISLQRPGYKIMIKSQLPGITSKAWLSVCPFKKTTMCSRYTTVIIPVRIGEDMATYTFTTYTEAVRMNY